MNLHPVLKWALCGAAIALGGTFGIFILYKILAAILGANGAFIFMLISGTGAACGAFLKFLTDI